MSEYKFNIEKIKEQLELNKKITKTDSKWKQVANLLKIRLINF